jgi:hypothetical protein
MLCNLMMDAIAFIDQSGEENPSTTELTFLFPPPGGKTGESPSSNKCRDGSAGSPRLT